MTKPTFVYFDVGNVILDFEGALASLATLVDIPYETCHQIWLKTDADICKGKAEPGILYERLTDLNPVLKRDLNFIEIWTGNFTPITEVHELIKILEQETKIGLFSNIYPGTYEHSLKNGCIPEANWRAKVFSCELGLTKPDDEIYALAEKLAKTNPAELLFIDDSEKNLETAKNRGWQTYQFDKTKAKKCVEEIKKILEVK